MRTHNKERENELARERYHWRKSHGICPRCKVRDAEPGRTLCFECLEYQRINNPKYQNKENHRLLNKKRVERLRSAGLCKTCGKKPVYTHNGKTYVECYECHIKTVNRARRKREETGHHWAELGLCVWCGCERVEDSTLCASCREKARMGAEYARECIAKKKEGWYVHPWKRAETERILLSRAKKS